MSKKRGNLLNNQKLLEIKISDGLLNLEEFTRTMSDNIDFNCFDILSITRTDSEHPYTRQYAHRKVDTQVYRVIADAIRYLIPKIHDSKLN
ncbi:MAG: hypothetical protein L0Z73_03755 [Gammaproteobacteria bacterium]|nr:hypothetical protein [Gammaproteobacteria bacterium]